MNILISRREVLNNIIRLKDKLLEDKEKREERMLSKSAPRFYPAVLNRQTGDIRFIEETGRFPLSDGWMEIRIDVNAAENEAACFAARDVKNAPLESYKFSELAWRIFAETLDTLNMIASQHLPKDPDVLPEEAALEDLSEIHLSEVAGAVEEMSGWKGKIDRFKTEALLKNQTVGTYLLRASDGFTESLAKELSNSNRMRVKPFLVNFKEEEERIGSRLILQTDRGWTAYRDNPDLKDSEYLYFSSPQEALRKLEPRAKKPLKE